MSTVLNSNATTCARESSSAFIFDKSTNSENVNNPVIHTTNNIKSTLSHSEMISLDTFITPSTHIGLFTSNNQNKKADNFTANNTAHTVVIPSFENALYTSISLSASETPALSLLKSFSAAYTIETSLLEKQERQTTYLSSAFKLSLEQESYVMTPTSLSFIYPTEASKPLQPSLQYVCVKNCPDGYYPNETSHKCLSCSDVCTNCSAIMSLGDKCNCSFTNSFDVLCRADFNKRNYAIVMIITTIVAMFLIAVVVIVAVLAVHKKRKRRLRRTKRIAIKSLWKQNDSTKAYEDLYVNSESTELHAASKNTTVPCSSQSLGKTVRYRTHTDIGDSECTVHKSVSYSSEFDFGKEYRCKIVDKHTPRTTDLNQKNLNEDFDVQHKSYDFLASKNTTVPCSSQSLGDTVRYKTHTDIGDSECTVHKSVSYSSEFDFGKEYRCKIMDKHTQRTTDLNQKNLNEDFDVQHKSYDFLDSAMWYDNCHSNAEHNLEQNSIHSDGNENVYDVNCHANSQLNHQNMFTADIFMWYDSYHSNAEHNLEQNSIHSDGNENVFDDSAMWYDNCHSNSEHKLEQDSFHSDRNENVYDDTFATVDQNCNGIHLHCFVDKRLSKKYQDILTSTSPTESMFINELFYALDNQSNEWDIKSEYVIISSLMRNHHEQYLDQEILLVAVENKLSFVCRWLLSHFHYDDECIVQVLSKSFEVGNNDIIKALAWKVTRQFYRKYQDILDKNSKDIYPAYKCECHNASTEKICLLTSKKLIAIEWNSNFLPNIPSTFLNFEITIFSYDDICDSMHEEEGEMKDIMSKIKKQFGSSSYSLQMQQIDGQVASKLFKQHRNLSLICPSLMKSTNYGFAHRVLQTQCIQFFCQRKGYIPLGETHFQANIKGIPTDVLQGHGYFASTTLRIGDKIGTQTTCGTLGGFYRIAGKYKCFLTCAHVLYSLSTLLAPKDDLCHDDEVEVFWDPQQGNRQCGDAFRGIFKHDDPSRTSVDAGLVMIKSQDFMIDHNDILRDINGAPQPSSSLGLSSPFVHQNYCDHTTLCCTRETVSVVAPGAVTKKEQNVTFQRPTHKDVYFQDIGQINGHANGLIFQPLLIAQPAHMQLPVGSLTEKRIFTMYNQMVMNIPLRKGDSGTCIYINGNTSQNTGCVGMAIAFCSGSGLSLVTPIQEIICAING
ncbi:PCSK5 [Mytilus coruscus]|uniref:PCSK5 n=1 Tax=Mytilus coruscus TaxID=42192 RepID=A0A6J8EEV9_MYTCO|nr:PCSK5 [Mytilus coruscus]